MSDNKNMLLEKWNKLIEVESAKPVPADLREQMAQILENQEEYITEGSETGDMAQFTPILIPAVRRIFPGLLAHEIVGVQPLNAPTGYAYALRYGYAGSTNKDWTKNVNVNTMGNIDRGTYQPSQGAMPQPEFASIALITSDGVKLDVNATAAQVQVADDNAGTNAEVIGGTSVYVENGRTLVLLTVPGTVSAKAAAGFFLSTDNGGSWHPISYVMNNEAGYNLIFQNYSGPYLTATGEKLGDPTGENFPAMKMALERVAVEAQTRKMKAEYTIELAQDLKNVHGLDAENELINILEYEITAELDRELIDHINAVATATTPWAYDTGTAFSPAVVGDGRWEQEKFRTLYTKIVRESNMIALTTRRGAGNFIVGSINAITALESLPSFMYSAVPGSIQVGSGVIKVGTLDGRFNVYIDTFSPVDYITVGYKGASQFDTGVIYCPYIPLMMQKVVDPDTFQPKVGFMQRSTYVNNLFGAANYYRKFFVDMTASSLSDTPLYF